MLTVETAKKSSLKAEPQHVQEKERQTSAWGIGGAGLCDETSNEIREITL